MPDCPKYADQDTGPQRPESFLHRINSVAHVARFFENCAEEKKGKKPWNRTERNNPSVRKG